MSCMVRQREADRTSHSCMRVHRCVMRAHTHIRLAACLCSSDGVGASTFDGGLKSLRKRGMMVTFGNASGAVPAIEPLTLTAHGSIFLTRPTVAHFVEEREELESRVHEIHAWIAADKLKLRIAKEFPLEQAKEAHEALESRQYAGKILLHVKAE
jgi:NADPH2:quinone reductase